MRRSHFRASGAFRSRRAAVLQAIEPRLCLAVNAWRSAVTGSWNDGTKWSLGHMPTTTEDVVITVPGNYTVTVPTAASTPYYYSNSVTVGANATGTQKLAVNAYLIVNKGFAVGAGDSIDITHGRFVASTPAGTNCQVDGSITLNGAYGIGIGSYLSLGAANVVGAGSIVFTVGGLLAPSANILTSNGASLGAGMTLRGKGGALQGAFTNKGAIKLEGGASDAWTFGFLNNQGSFVSPGGSPVTVANLVNAAGHIVSVTGGSLTLKETYSNAGTISATNSKLNYGMTFAAAGAVTRVNTPVYFSGVMNGNGGTIVPSDPAGQWIWTTGKLTNGSYDAAAITALKVDKTAPGGNYGALDKVTLTGDLAIPGGFYVNGTNGTTLSNGHRILLNGSATTGVAAFYSNSSSIGGTGEVVFNTAATAPANNLLSGTGWSLGPGVLLHGKSGRVGGGFTNNGIVLADSAGETIQVVDATNAGNLIAAPGTLSIAKFSQTSGGALTVGIGGTGAGSSFGQLKFTDAVNAPSINGKFNVVTLNGYAPASAATFTISSFAKAPVGTFATKNLDAGNGKAFDLTQSTTAMSLKAKTVAGAFAVRGSTGALTVTGTAAGDTISTLQSQGVLYSTMAGKTSAFLDSQITTEAVNAMAGADAVTANGSRGVTLSGGDGDDSLTGGGGGDNLNGGEGSDLLAGGGGGDTYAFGNALSVQTDTVAESTSGGTDTLDFSALTGAVSVKLATDATLAVMTSRVVRTQFAGQYANFENATGGAGIDSLTGNAAANRLIGGAGNDVIDGNDGNDALYGGLGNDKLTGGTGLDSLYGEAGNDTLFGADGGIKDLLDGGADADAKGSADLIDVLVSVP